MRFSPGIRPIIVLSLVQLLNSTWLHGEETEKKFPTETNPVDGAEMVLIPAGTLLMGSTPEEINAQFKDTGLPDEWKKHTQDEEPRHERTVDGFLIYKYEVTNAQYRKFIQATGRRAPPHWTSNGYPPEKGKHPVVEVSWDDAQAYCQWAGAQLPTEVQWEYAARGPSPGDGRPSRAFPWGDAWDRKLCNNGSLHADRELTSADAWKAWYDGDQTARYPLTTPVGSYPQSASPFGLHDLAGNAWEWCDNLPTAYPDQKAEDVADHKLRARRGGSWANVAMHIRSADRQPAARDDLNLYTGFRCVKPR